MTFGLLSNVLFYTHSHTFHVNSIAFFAKQNKDTRTEANEYKISANTLKVYGREFVKLANSSL